MPLALGLNTSGLVQVASNTQIDQVEKSLRDQRKAEEEQNKPEILGLAAHIRTCWEAAKRGKMEIEEVLLQCMRQKKGVYDPDQLAKIRKHGKADIYMKITGIKCRAAIAWIKDVMIPPGEKPWSIDPTPVPDLPDDLEDEIIDRVGAEANEIIAAQGDNAVNPNQIRTRLEEVRSQILRQQREIAKATTLRMETHIEDELVEGNYYQALSEFIEDIVTYPAAFMKGPVIRKEKALTWSEDEDGQPVPQITEVYRKIYERVSPFDIYPSPGAKSVQDGYLIERLRLRRSDLTKLIGVPGYKEAGIRGVLIQYGLGGLKDWLWTDQEKADAESKPQFQEDPEAIIDGLLYSGNAQGKTLLEWGMTKEQIPDPDLDYQISALVIGNWVPMARINPHPLGRRNYYSTSFSKVNDSIWGECVPILMRDIQRMCNNAARALANNMGIASGPLLEVHQDRLDPTENIEDLYPWKIIKTLKDDTGRGDKGAVYFFQPDMNAQPLQAVYDYYFKQASEVSGIPAYMYGSEKVGGAGKTASGLSMLMNAAGKTLKAVVINIDEGLVRPSIKEHWITLMLYDKKIEKVGDINIIARASEYLIIAEQLQVRRTEFLNFTNNPVDMSIIGVKGRATVLRETAKSLKMPTEDVVPSKEEMEERERMQEAQNQLMIEQSQQVAPEGEAALLPGGQPAGGVEG